MTTSLRASHVALVLDLDGLLDLPAEIRRRIYLLASLVRVCPINLNLERAGWDEIDRWTCLPVRLPAPDGQRRVQLSPEAIRERTSDTVEVR